MGAACRRDRSEGYNGFKADVWSAGILLYTLTSGLRPFQGRPEDDDKVVMMRATQQRHVDTLFAQLARIGASAELIELLRGMLCIDPSQRLSMLQVRCTSPPLLRASPANFFILLLDVHFLRAQLMVPTAALILWLCQCRPVVCRCQLKVLDCCYPQRSGAIRCGSIIHVVCRHHRSVTEELS